jgi:hypothetical protein
VRLRDLGSTNGTRVNGELVRHEVVLNDGDKVTIGKLELELHLRKTAPVEAIAANGASATIELPPSGLEEPATAASETSYELPAAAETAATIANFAGDTAIHNAQGAPPMAGAYPGMPGYGYPPGMMPGYPPGYPVAYPGYGYPLGYPQPGYPAAMPGYPTGAPPQQAPAAPAGGQQGQANKVSEMPVRLPDPEHTGIKAPPPPPPVDPAAAAAPPSGNETEKSANSAADIIKQYMQRRGTK